MAMKEGAYDYLSKPFELDELQLVLERAFEQRQLKQENQDLHAQLLEVYGERNIIFSSDKMHNCFKMAQKVANTEATVLITGESGTGKELITRYIHTHSLRGKKPFITFDCAALPENLLETELFGHEKGAFTGAIIDKPGIIEMAKRGTLFLDEIGELSLNLQAKLLRVLQERQYRRVGGNKFLQADVRFLAATNRSLESEVESGRFRADLYYRLSVFPIRMPPLRERPEDIFILAMHFLKKYGEKNNKQINRFSHQARRLMEEHQWPGNVRELQNVVERAVLLAEGHDICPSDLSMLIPVDAKPEAGQFVGLNYKEIKNNYIEVLEKQYFTNLLHKYEGNITKASEEAGVNRRTIHRLISKYHLY
jgi:DNA-binding NtrC family response regulator